MRKSFLILTVVHSLFAFSCSQVEYTRNSANYTSNSQTFEESNVQSSYEEKEKYKTVYRKSNLEALAIGRNRLEIQNLMANRRQKS